MNPLMRHIRRAMRRPMRIALLAALTLPLVPALAVPAHAHRRVPEPVILVPGWRSSPAVFTRMRTALEGAGHPAYAVELPGEENVANAGGIRALMERVRREHGGAKVSLVAHSMGGLSARHYLKFLGGADETLSYVSMGTAHLGYLPACLVPPDRGGQMCPLSDFLIRLNAGDPTPGPVAYTLLTSSLDASRDQDLPGVRCKAEFPGVPHVGEPESPVFIDAVLAVLAGGCPTG